MYINFETKEYFLKKHPDGPIICTTFKWGFSLPGPGSDRIYVRGLLGDQRIFSPSDRGGGVELFTLAWTGGLEPTIHFMSCQGDTFL